MDEIISGIDTFHRFAQMLFVEDIALNYFGSGKSSIEASSVASKATNGMAGLEQARHKASPDISRRAGHQDSHIRDIARGYGCFGRGSGDGLTRMQRKSSSP